MALLLTVAALLIVLVVEPEWLASTDGLRGKDRAVEIGRTRTALAGLIVVVAAIVGAVYTARNYDLNREGQITERFTRAIEQLGSETRPVRVGGAYALERIALNSPRDHARVMEVLTAYVQEHAPPPTPRDSEVREPQPRDPAGGRAAKTGRSDSPRPEEDQARGRKPAVDVQAALTVIGRRTVAYDETDHEGKPKRLDLRWTDLRGADLHFAHLERADFTGAHFEKADDRDGAYLRKARLEGADFQYAHLEGARLWGACLKGAILEEAHLEGAICDSETKWGGFDYLARGVILRAEPDADTESRSATET